MSPILLRPSREQDEHDRLARHLEARYAKKKLDVFVNVRDEQLMPVKFGTLTRYPDLVLGEAKKLAGVVEIETGESVNNLEALAQWVHFGKAKVPFHLYVPAHMYEATRRLSDTYKARNTEIWTYRGAVDGFDLVRMYADGQAKFPKPSVVLKPNPPKPVVIPPPPPPPPPVPAKGPLGPKGRPGLPTGKAALPAPKGKGVVPPVPAPAAMAVPPKAKPTAGKSVLPKPPMPAAKAKAPVVVPRAKPASKPAPQPVAKAKGRPSAVKGKAKKSAAKRPKPAPPKKHAKKNKKKR